MKVLKDHYGTPVYVGDYVVVLGDVKDVYIVLGLVVNDDLHLEYVGKHSKPYRYKTFKYAYNVRKLEIEELI
jgi:hypothetical protein